MAQETEKEWERYDGNSQLNQERQREKAVGFLALNLRYANLMDPEENS